MTPETLKASDVRASSQAGRAAPVPAVPRAAPPAAERSVPHLPAAGARALPLAIAPGAATSRSPTRPWRRPSPQNQATTCRRSTAATPTAGRSAAPSAAPSPSTTASPATARPATRARTRPRWSRWVLIAAVLACSGLTACTPAMTREQRAAAIGVHVDRALELIRAQWSEHRDLERSGAQFDAELEAIEDLTDSETLDDARAHEGESMAAKLIVMAAYVDDHRHRVEELLERVETLYRRDIYYSPVSKAEWKQPQDRLAWEYVLLRPGPRGFEFPVMTTALSRIADPRTTISGRLVIELILAGHDSCRSKLRLTFWMYAMVLVAPSRASLDAFLSFSQKLEPLRHACSSPGADDPPGRTPEELAGLLDAPADWVRDGIMRRADRAWKPVLAEVGRTATPEFKAQLAAWLRLSERDLFEDFPWPRPEFNDH